MISKFGASANERMELSLPEMENADYAGLMIRGGKENLI
jgi:hypothetical protein